MTSVSSTSRGLVTQLPTVAFFIGSSEKTLRRPTLKPMTTSATRIMVAMPRIRAPIDFFGFSSAAKPGIGRGGGTAPGGTASPCGYGPGGGATGPSCGGVAGSGATGCVTDLPFQESLSERRNGSDHGVPPATPLPRCYRRRRRHRRRGAALEELGRVHGRTLLPL